MLASNQEWIPWISFDRSISMFCVFFLNTKTEVWYTIGFFLLLVVVIDKGLDCVKNVKETSLHLFVMKNCCVSIERRQQVSNIVHHWEKSIDRPTIRFGTGYSTSFLHKADQAIHNRFEYLFSFVIHWSV